MGNSAHNDKIRNIAIIAHVDHGKTTLVDSMLGQSGALSRGGDEVDRVMDSMELERERGITIAAKNCSVAWNGVKINILDTPGHADFGGEVERALQMVDGCVLLVDASEGPLPQTRFVLSKALQSGLSMIVVINKIDRSDARPAEVLDEVYDLFIDLDANEEQIEFPVLYAIGKDGVASKDKDGELKDLKPLFDTIVETIPGPKYKPDEPFQLLVSNLGYSDYLGRLAIGRVVNGKVKQSDKLVRIDSNSKNQNLAVKALQVYHGTAFESVQEIETGDIAILAGIEEVEIGDTITSQANPKALNRISVDEPTISVAIGPNNSPFSGTEGKFVQSTRIRERLLKESLHNVALRVIDVPAEESFIVQGRGEFQMAILLETMRREGYELSVGRPQIIFKDVNGEQHEPIEHLFVDCDEAHTGVVTEKLSFRKGRMTNLVNHGSGRTRLEFSIPSRGLIGYRSEFLTDTRGTGIMNALFDGYEPHRGEFPSRITGSLVSDRLGESVTYGLFHLEPRGQMFIGAGEKVYEGMIIGEHNRENDLNVNPTKSKKLSNMRASGKDDALVLTPAVKFTIEQCLQWVRDDELIEITPKSIRMRKKELSQQRRS